MVQLWKSHSGILRTRLDAPQATIQAVSWSPDGRSLAAGDDGTRAPWTSREGQE